MAIGISPVSVGFDIIVGGVLTIIGIPLIIFVPPVGGILLGVGLASLGFGLFALACGCVSSPNNAPGAKSLFSRIFGGEEKSESVSQSKGSGLLARMFGGKSVEAKQAADVDAGRVHNYGFTLGNKASAMVVKVNPALQAREGIRAGLK